MVRLPSPSDNWLIITNDLPALWPSLPSSLRHYTWGSLTSRQSLSYSGMEKYESIPLELASDYVRACNGFALDIGESAMNC